MYFGYLIDEKNVGNRQDYEKYLKWLEYEALLPDKIDAFKESLRMADTESIKYLVHKFPYLEGFVLSKL